MTLLGNLSLASIPYENPIVMGAFGFMILAVITVLLLITYFGLWTYLWKEWLTSVDHKRIGVMYIAVAIIMGLRGFSDAVLMRSQLALSHGTAHGYLNPNHYDQIFTAHGVLMIFFMAMPFMIGLINFAVPLQIGARDVAFPFLNSVSIWLFITAAILMNASLGIGEFANTGWVAYPPLSELAGSPGVGVDYYIWSLQIAGASSLLTGINFVTTIIKLRAPGMTMMRMPLFTWAALGTNLLMVGAFPILTVDLALLALDRYLGMHFFTNTGGGNMMLYVNWFWAWGHPEVYILVLPAFGVFSEVISTFSGRQLFGYPSMVYSLMAITIISYLVWLHHFFIMGAGGNVNAVFGIATMIIAVPTGVKVFNWLFTIYHGKVRFATPMLWSLGFIITFVIGGMTGVMLSIPPADFVLHNSQFVVAHFHNTIIGGTVLGAFAGMIYWFPKAFGFKMNESYGKVGFWLFVSGFFVTFMPLYLLGFMGMTRRINHFDNPAWVLPVDIAGIGVILFAFSLVFLLLQMFSSFFDREKHRDKTGDPWNARSLEWSLPSPPPHYNFAIIPTVTCRDEFWHMKQQGINQQHPTEYQDILMFKNTSAGVFIGLASLFFGFGMIWHIWWMAILGLLGIVVTLVIRTCNDDIYYIIPADEVKHHEEEHKQNY